MNEKLSERLETRMTLRVLNEEIMYLTIPHFEAGTRTEARIEEVKKAWEGEINCFDISDLRCLWDARQGEAQGKDRF